MVTKCWHRKLILCMLNKYLLQKTLQNQCYKICFIYRNNIISSRTKPCYLQLHCCQSCYYRKWNQYLLTNPNQQIIQQHCAPSFIITKTWIITTSTLDPHWPHFENLGKTFIHTGDNYWIIDTDYDNYAVTYACRTLKDDGTCDDGYALVFSRNSLGLPPAIQRIVRQKQAEICMAGQFKPVLQSGQAMEKCTRTQLDLK